MIAKRFAVVPFLTALFAPVSWAADSNGSVFTDPAHAGPDYALQGEYRGSIETDNGERVYGVQVIALGDGKYRCIGYTGGLPGDGWSRGDEVNSTESEAVDGKISFPLDQADIEITPEKVAILVGGREVGKFPKVQRKSPTLGMKAPSDAIVLFDGSSADAFENGKLVEEKLLGATNVASKEKLGDHQLHIEFRTPFMPKSRGQGRGNSGVYVQGRYEVQVLDSFGLNGENNECGGIYSISKPIVNMCLPPLSWQTYDIDFVAARYDDTGNKSSNAKVTIKHNGVVIHDDLELPHGTPGYHAEGPQPDSLFLQDHGNPVVFRNIWVVKK